MLNFFYSDRSNPREIEMYFLSVERSGIKYGENK